MRISRVLFVVLAIFLFTGCKIRIFVPEGGLVTTQSGAFSCQTGKICSIDVVDIFFDETFIATPSDGYVFKSWKKRDRGFCGGNSKPCHLFTSGFTGNDALMEFLETSEVFYLQPVFEKKTTTCASGGSSAPTSSKLTLSGSETARVGNELTTGGTAFGRTDLTGPIESLIIVDQCSTISDEPAAFPPGDPRNTASFNTADPDNTFVMVVSEAAISMVIVKEAVPYRYACDSDFTVFMDCGGLDFDVATRTLTVTNVTVENTDTGSVLTLNGSVVWKD